MDTQIHFVRVKRTVGGKLQQCFLEVIIPSVAHDGRDTVALFVQRGGREPVAGMDQTARVACNASHFGNRYIHFVVADGVRLVRRDDVGQVHFAVLDTLDCIHLSMEIAHIMHLLLELLHADARQVFVVHHRCLTHLMGVLRHFLQRFGGGVGGSGVVDMELQFPETENLGVLFLPQVAAQLGGGDRLVIDAGHPCFVEQVAVLGHELRRVARCHKTQYNQQCPNPYSAHPFAICQPSCAHKKHAKLLQFLHICK